MTHHRRAFLVFCMFLFMFIWLVFCCIVLVWGFLFLYKSYILSCLFHWSRPNGKKRAPINLTGQMSVFRSLSLFLCIFYSVSAECGECLLTFGMTCQNHVVFSDFCLYSHASDQMWLVHFCLWEVCFHSVASSRQVTQWLSEHWPFGLSLFSPWASTPWFDCLLLSGAYLQSCG